jgi:hypothetical protein
MFINKIESYKNKNYYYNSILKNIELMEEDDLVMY